jgi:cytoskeletal protein RodZ
MMNMGQFGQELRREREARGIALGSIRDTTKISERHLVALEEERFDSLPGGVLSKGMVRGYARAVGLDEDDWVSRYLSAYHQSGQIKDDDMAWMEFAENVGRARKGDDFRPGQRMRWLGVALLLTLLALFCWYVVLFVGERAVSWQQVSPSSLICVEGAHLPGLKAGADWTSPGSVTPEMGLAKRTSLQ